MRIKITNKICKHKRMRDGAEIENIKGECDGQ